MTSSSGNSSPEMLAAVLEGLLLRRRQLDEQIQKVRQLLGVGDPEEWSGEPELGRVPGRKSWMLSKAARRRIIGSAEEALGRLPRAKAQRS